MLCSAWLRTMTDGSPVEPAEFLTRQEARSVPGVICSSMGVSRSARFELTGVRARSLTSVMSSGCKPASRNNRW